MKSNKSNNAATQIWSNFNPKADARVVGNQMIVFGLFPAPIVIPVEKAKVLLDALNASSIAEF
jgi:hypothetical protein